jgi:transcriptional regulator with XRE-family HTH domain
MQKPTRNAALKHAIFESGREQRRIAKLARISAEKLSHAIYGRRTLDAKERERLAKVLGKSEDELFGATQSEAVAS